MISKKRGDIELLNKDGNRELCYLVKIDNVIPHPNADRLDIAEIGGWRCIVGKGEFKSGDIGVYFEVDSRLPECKPFTDMEFLVSKHYKIKTQKIRGEFSQGLLVSLDTFNNTEFYDSIHGAKLDDESRFLSGVLKVAYISVDDNKRKSKSSNVNEKYNRMARRHPNIAKKKWFRWLMKREWGKELLFVFLGKKKDKPRDFPTNFPGVNRTDQERCENMTWILNDKTPYIVAQKCDGSSATYILEKRKHGKYEFYVCSRNIRMLDENQDCYYDDNFYWQMAKKYDIEAKMREYLKENDDIDWICW